jgi:hypothetical protein
MPKKLVILILKGAFFAVLGFGSIPWLISCNLPVGAARLERILQRVHPSTGGSRSYRSRVWKDELATWETRRGCPIASKDLKAPLVLDAATTSNIPLAHHSPAGEEC